MPVFCHATRLKSVYHLANRLATCCHHPFRLTSVPSPLCWNLYDTRPQQRATSRLGSRPAPFFFCFRHAQCSMSASQCCFLYFLRLITSCYCREKTEKRKIHLHFFLFSTLRRLVSSLVFPSSFPHHIGLAYRQLTIGYLNTGLYLHRTDSNTRSLVFSDFGQFLDGIVTVRAFSALGIVTGLRNPQVSATGWPGVWVRVGFIQSSPYPYPLQGLAGQPEI